MSTRQEQWEKFYEAQTASNDQMREAIRRVDDEDEKNATHECLACGYRCHISTPQIKTQNWCQGTCDGFSTFKRLDKIES